MKTGDLSYWKGRPKNVQSTLSEPHAIAGAVMRGSFSKSMSW